MGRADGLGTIFVHIISEIQRRPDVLGVEHPDNLILKLNLAQVLDAQGQVPEASALLDGLRAKMLEHVEETHGWITDLDAFLAKRGKGGET